MKSWISLFTFAMAFASTSAALAENITRTALSGKTTTMFIYRSWTAGDCASASGVVRVLTKPQHGKLTPHPNVDTTIVRNRIRPSDSRCQGLPVKGFQVDYTSAPGYHGTDSFVIEATFWHGGKIVDTFTVMVE
jgi:hypothetical protein